MFALVLFACASFVATRADMLFEINGRVVIESPSPYVLVSVNREGRRVALIDTGARNQARLRPGVYELGIEGKSQGLRPEHDKVRLRGGETLYVRLVPTGELPR